MSEIRELNNVSLPFALDDRKNYIYIQDAKRENLYFCPCCGKELITAAIDEDKEYKVPAYYRHKPNEKCDAESLAHWVYKIWLFNKGSQFYVFDGYIKTLYTVESIDIEKTYNTDFGDYRPDITITTSIGKVFFFEINFSSPKRSDDYYCKWWELNNDVIEVDIMKLQKESFNDRIPTFKLIYFEGICYDSKYNRKDVFAGITKELYDRKEEIKRQDMLNYKIVWEKLDWFWNEIKKYKAMKSTMENVLNSFSEIPYEEMEMCFNIVRRITCINNNQGFRDVINENFNVNISKLVSDYNEKARGIASFSIRKNSYYKTEWDIVYKLNDYNGIIQLYESNFEDSTNWRKHYMPHSFYMWFYNQINSFYEKSVRHFLLIKLLENDVLALIKPDEDFKYSHFCRSLFETENDVDDIKKDFIISLNAYRYKKKKEKIEKVLKKFNNNNEHLKCEYDVTNDANYNITCIQLTLYTTMFKDSFNLNIKICTVKFNEEEVNDFVKLSDKEIYNKIVKLKENYDKNGIIDMNFADILSSFKAQIKHNCYNLFLDMYCPDIYTVKFRMSFRVNHGNHWDKQYKYYRGKYIELKNNYIDDLYISEINLDELYDILLEKLLESKKVALRMFSKFDGINSDTRFLFAKEDK